MNNSKGRARSRTSGAKSGGHWPAVLTLALAALPFLSGAAWTSYRSLWFQYAAERAVGTVAEVAPDGALAVEYLTKSEEFRTAGTGGSDYYKGYRAGDKLTVFYDPRNPADARIDLWLEHWIAPLLLAIPGVLILLTMLLILSHLRKAP